MASGFNLLRNDVKSNHTGEQRAQGRAARHNRQAALFIGLGASPEPIDRPRVDRVAAFTPPVQPPIAVSLSRPVHSRAAFSLGLVVCCRRSQLLRLVVAGGSELGFVPTHKCFVNARYTPYNSSPSANQGRRSPALRYSRQHMRDPVDLHACMVCMGFTPLKDKKGSHASRKPMQTMQPCRCHCASLASASWPLLAPRFCVNAYPETSHEH